MNSLIVDTSTKNLYLALVIDGVIIDTYQNSSNKEHSKNIMPQIEIILHDNNLDVRELNAIYIGIGPGSYTGVRIGVSVCKMLAWTLKIPLYQFSSLFAMSSAYEKRGAAIDARRGNVFCGVYDKNEVVVKEALRKYDDFKAMTDLIIDEDHFCLDPLKVMENSKLVNPHACVPNYLRDTEAERNLHGEKND